MREFYVERKTKVSLLWLLYLYGIEIPMDLYNYNYLNFIPAYCGKRIFKQVKSATEHILLIFLFEYEQRQFKFGREWLSLFFFIFLGVLCPLHVVSLVQIFLIFKVDICCPTLQKNSHHPNQSKDHG